MAATVLALAAGIALACGAAALVGPDRRGTAGIAWWTTLAASFRRGLSCSDTALDRRRTPPQ
ncbi:hypothetical protein ACIGZJ_20750 [Kitasatospora sp. NPDC052868]|uniref:hypothetical protein n=1 Tax=Kitasatospora sp. NPDC052868 TaxID=3364060 RepID=UPI0037C7699E